MIIILIINPWCVGCSSSAHFVFRNCLQSSYLYNRGWFYPASRGAAGIAAYDFPACAVLRLVGWLVGGWWSRVRQTQYGEYRLRTESENTNITITLRVQAFNTYYVQQTDQIFFVKHSYY